MKRLILIGAAVASLVTAGPLGGAALALDGPRVQKKHSDAESSARDVRRPKVKALRQDVPKATPRRGGYLPDAARGEVVQDVERYRLRPPPRGFAWVRMGDGFALVSLADGRVYDVVK